MNRISAMARRHLAFIVCVIAPGLLATVYFGWIARDVFYSDSIISLQSISADSRDDSALSFLGLASRSRAETQSLRDYMLSADMARSMDAEFELKKVWQEPEWDVIGRLRRSARLEDFMRYYREAISVEFDELSGSLRIRVMSFEPKHARDVNAGLILQSERFANQIANGLMREQLAFVDTETTKAEQKLVQARAEFAEFQAANGMLRADEQVKAQAELINGLRAKMTQAEIELGAARSYLNDRTPQIVTLENAVKSLRVQIAKETESLRALQRPLSDLSSKQREYTERIEFLTHLYTKTLETRESVRVDASRKIKTLSVIETPSVPERADYMLRIRQIVLSWILFVGLWATVRLTRRMLMEMRN
jgi:capsular polysaccharide transport system permease protein